MPQADFNTLTPEQLQVWLDSYYARVGRKQPFKAKLVEIDLNPDDGSEELTDAK